MFEVNKLYGTWLLTDSLFARFLQTRDRSVSVTSEQCSGIGAREPIRTRVISATNTGHIIYDHFYVGYAFVYRAGSHDREIWFMATTEA